ncbi:MAG: hypothetical protein IBX47_11670, partial [Desulfuromonadales bacterium]|nr:hypothetical protein [Desulfuromonadales bacterium]
MKIVTRLLAVSLSSFLLFLCLAAPASALNTMLSYEQYPPIVTEPTKPNVLVLISNDWTGFTEGYHDAYDNKVDYWGYFDNRKEYKYENSNYFSPVGIIGSDHYTTNNTYWSGNFLNWATMSHADFLRKALTGGRRSIDAVASTRLIRGLIPSAKGWKKSYTGADLNRLVPSTYAVSSYKFSNYGTEMDVTNSSGNSQIAGQKLSLEVEVCNEALPEKNCGTYSGVSKPEGLLQHYKDKMLFGLMSYSHSIQDQGGIVRQLLGDISSHINSNGQLPSSGNSILRYINNYTEKGWDPLAEMYYDAVRYLRGNTAAQAAFCPSSNSDDGYGFYGCADSTNNRWIDPVQSWCQKSSIVIINDEYPSREHDKIPYSAFNPGYRDTPKFAAGNTPYNPNVVELLAEITQLEGLNGTEGELAEKVGNTNNTCRPQTIDNLANFKGICPAEGNSQGTFSLAALAYDAFKNDMRSDLDNKQSFRTYAIAFRATSGTYEVPKPPLNQMYLAGKYGNFDDMNGNGVPDLPEEWMKGADLCTSDNPESDNCLPKGFFYAEGGDAIEKALKEVVESILRRSASGTAVSVLATSGKGEGNLVQAYYRPARLEPTADGVSRDVVWTGYLQSLWIDKYGNMREDSDNDQQLDVTKDKIIKFIIDTDGSTKVSRYAVSSDIPFPATNDTSTDQIEMGDVKVVWEAGARLAATASADRNIFTGIDLNFDGVVDKGESLPFTTASTAIRPYLA